MTLVRFARLAGSGGLALATGALGAVAVTGPAQAASCSGAVRYARSTNTIYLGGATSFTPARILAACPAAPLTRSAGRTWYLAADLVLLHGSTLVLHGARRGGDVDTLRIRSLPSNRSTEVQQITAAYGTIDIDGVRITSWDGDGPDTDPALPATRRGSDRGRAFIRAVSSLAADGTVRLSTMTIRDSSLSFLGYDAAESYGVSYKARGCDRAHVALCRRLTVGGGQTGSRFEHNYVGTYLWGARAMVLRGNTYSGNVSYGLDVHDASSDLTIDSNRFTRNGGHGLIASQRCDRLTITRNVVDHNGVRRSGGDPVHGIMLHSGVTGTKVVGNTVTGQAAGAGIAVADSTGDTVAGNTLARNRWGIRLTAGSARNTFTANTVTDSTDNAVVAFVGRQAATYSTRSGRPTGNTFVDTTIAGTGGPGISLTDTDATTFERTALTKLGAPLRFTRAAGTTWRNAGRTGRQPIVVTGTAARPSSLTLVVRRDAAAVTADRYSTVTYR